MSFKIDPNKCASCGMCVPMCQYGAISAAAGKYQIDPVMCKDCGACTTYCPMGAIAKEEPTKPAMTDPKS